MELIHTRNYEIQVLRVSDRELLARGAVRDVKPGGLYLPDDPDPLAVHHMTLELRVAYPSLEITAAEVQFRVYPEDPCPTIVEHYGNLVGLSIARGFTHKVRELFGGPRGCTHTTALLQALAPAVVQSTFSMQLAWMRSKGISIADAMVSGGGEVDPEARRRAVSRNINSCHMWDEHGEMVARLDRGEPPVSPVFIRQRLAERGITDAPTWRGLGR